jgi:hypothetical protein
MNQVLVHHKPSNRSYVTLGSPTELVNSVQDFLDLSGWAGEHNTNLILLSETNFPAAFYDLSTRVAGEILQKVSNYHLRLVVFGSFDGMSERFREFMRESNKGRQVRFARTHDEAVAWLTS